jgi:hypothetical protein
MEAYKRDFSDDIAAFVCGLQGGASRKLIVTKFAGRLHRGCHCGTLVIEN